MSEEIKPKKERKFLKTLGKIGKVLIQELFFRIGSNLIKRIGGKKQLPSILLLLLSFASYAAVDSIPYPVTGNKQRLGFQTTGNGLVYRGRAADTITKPSSYVDKNVKAYLILDSVRGTIFVWRQTRWDSILVGGVSTSFDTTTLNLVNRFALKLNKSDTAAMLSPYAKKSYVDTAGRFYARQDYINATSSTLTWTQTDTLVPAGVNVVMIYRNGQILLTSQYTIPNKTTVIIAASSFKLGENYTVIFPKGGGGSGSGSGSLTSISGGTGITVNPNPITTTGTVSADLSVLMELTDTVTLSNRINTKLTATDTASLSSRINLKLTATDTASLSSRINLKLNFADTASLSNRINLKGSGTVTSIAMGYGITSTQSPLTTSGTLRIDSSVIFSRIRDSIVDVAIGNDTIKIIKQEYAPALSSVLTFTVLPKFPIQLKAFILVFRNGQLLNNEQYNLTDTNKITIVSSSFKLGSNYTVITVSGIGSVGTGVFPNPVYPEAGIALSTGSAWASSITNNSLNWNIAFNDKINNAAFTGTTTKTLTLTQSDGGTFTPTFTDLQGVTGVTAGSGLTGGTISTTGTVAVDFTTVAPLASPTFTGTVGGITSTMVGLTNVDNTSDANKPISSATQTALNTKQNTLSNASTEVNGILTAVNFNIFNNKQSALNGTGFVKASGLTISYDNLSYLPLTGGTLTGNLRLSSSVGTQLNIDASDNDLESRITFSTAGSARSKIYTTSSVASMTFESIAQASARRGFRFISSSEEVQYLGLVQDPIGNVGIKSDATGNNVHPNTLYVNGTLGVTGAVTLSTTTSTPTALLGKDTSNVVGTVTTVAQTGLFERGTVTNATTDANGNITVAHGFNFTPIMAFANLPGQTANAVNVKSVDGTNIVFVVRDGSTYNPLNGQTVTKIEFFAIK